MAIIKCTQGHYYDNAKHSSCPFCKAGIGLKDEDKTQWHNPSADVRERFRLVTPSPDMADSEITIGFHSPRRGNDYVVGWLVCTKGPDKGRDFRLHHGFNRIGREERNDIVLANDKGVSREAHCSVVYEGKENRFYLSPQPGHITYYKGEFLDTPVPLLSRDIFEIGSSTMEFIAFCEGDKRWVE